jgi:hypothetical protein
MSASLKCSASLFVLLHVMLGILILHFPSFYVAAQKNIASSCQNNYQNVVKLLVIVGRASIRYTLLFFISPYEALFGREG